MEETKLKLITYNIDGLPEKLDLDTLPLVFKPISFIYKLFKKTSVVKVNDNENTEERMKEIGKYLLNQSPDIIAVQEDFNYHKELTEDFYDIYSWGIYSGGFDLKNIFKSVTWFPRPRFKADGLNLFGKVGKIHFRDEQIISWNKSYGYIDHANDLLTHKGFRYYDLEIDNKYRVDVYVVHMDADFYHPENCPDVSKDIEARKSQFNQLTDFILNIYNSGSVIPVIIMGDTNSYDKYEWDKRNIEMELIHKINHEKNLKIKEAVPDNYSDCDKIFFINNDNADYELVLENCYFDKDKNLSDHKPLIANFKFKDK